MEITGPEQQSVRLSVSNQGQCRWLFGFRKEGVMSISLRAFGENPAGKHRDSATDETGETAEGVEDSELEDDDGYQSPIMWEATDEVISRCGDLECALSGEEGGRFVRRKDERVVFECSKRCKFCQHLCCFRRRLKEYHCLLDRRVCVTPDCDGYLLRVTALDHDGQVLRKYVDYKMALEDYRQLQSTTNPAPSSPASSTTQPQQGRQTSCTSQPGLLKQQRQQQKLLQRQVNPDPVPKRGRVHPTRRYLNTLSRRLPPVRDLQNAMQNANATTQTIECSRTDLQSASSENNLAAESIAPSEGEGETERKSPCHSPPCPILLMLLNGVISPSHVRSTPMMRDLAIANLYAKANSLKAEDRGIRQSISNIALSLRTPPSSDDEGAAPLPVSWPAFPQQPTNPPNERQLNPDAAPFVPSASNSHSQSLNEGLPSPFSVPMIGTGKDYSFEELQSQELEWMHLRVSGSAETLLYHHAQSGPLRHAKSVDGTRIPFAEANVLSHSAALLAQDIGPPGGPVRANMIAMGGGNAAGVSTLAASVGVLDRKDFLPDISEGLPRSRNLYREDSPHYPPHYAPQSSPLLVAGPTNHNRLPSGHVRPSSMESFFPHGRRKQNSISIHIPAIQTGGVSNGCEIKQGTGDDLLNGSIHPSASELRKEEPRLPPKARPAPPVLQKSMSCPDGTGVLHIKGPSEETVCKVESTRTVSADLMATYKASIVPTYRPRDSSYNRLRRRAEEILRQQRKQETVSLTQLALASFASTAAAMMSNCHSLPHSIASAAAIMSAVGAAQNNGSSDSGDTQSARNANPTAGDSSSSSGHASVHHQGEGGSRMRVPSPGDNIGNWLSSAATRLAVAGPGLGRASAAAYHHPSAANTGGIPGTIISGIDGSSTGYHSLIQQQQATSGGGLWQAEEDVSYHYDPGMVTYHHLQHPYHQQWSSMTWAPYDRYYTDGVTWWTAKVDEQPKQTEVQLS